MQASLQDTPKGVSKGCSLPGVHERESCKLEACLELLDESDAHFQGLRQTMNVAATFARQKISCHKAGLHNMLRLKLSYEFFF